MQAGVAQHRYEAAVEKPDGGRVFLAVAERDEERHVVGRYGRGSQVPEAFRGEVRRVREDGTADQGFR